MAAADYTSVVQQLYISYFGRPADYYGLTAFANQLNAIGAPTTFSGLNDALQGPGNTGLKNLVSGSFANTAESVRLYGTPTSELQVSQFVSAVFENVLHRQPLLEGLNYWVGEIFSGRVSMTSAAVAITNGALLNTTPQGLIDAAVIANTNAVAVNFTAALDTPAEINAFSGQAAAAAAQALLLTVTDTTNVAAFQANVDAAVSTLVNGSNVGQTFTLTTGVDQGSAFTGGAGNDSFVAISAGTANALNTLNAADVLNGSTGTDSLNITVTATDTNTLGSSQITGIETINVRSAVAGQTATVAASSAIGATSVNSNAGAGSLTVTALATGAAVGIIGNGTVTNGTVTFDYTTATDAVTLNVSGGTKVGTTVATTADTPTSVTINSTGAANTLGSIDFSTGATVTALNINATTDLTATLAADYAATAALTVTGAGKVNIGANGTFKTVDASANTGGLVMTVDTVTTSFKGSATNDTITTATLAAPAAGIIDAGEGTADTLVVAAVDVATAALRGSYTNFEVLNNATNAAIAADGFTGITSLITSVAGGGFTAMTAAQAASIDVTADLAATATTYALTTSTGTADVLGLNIASATATTELDATALTVTGFETLNLAIGSGSTTLYNAAGTTQLTAGTDYSNIDFAAAANLKTVNVSGAYAAKVDVSTFATVTAVNASANTAGVDLVTGGQTGSLVVTGSEARDVIALGAAGAGGLVTVHAGAGNDSITAAQADVAVATIDGGAGTDTLTVSNGGTVTINDNNFAGVSSIEHLAFGAVTGLTFSVGGYANALATANAGVLDVTAASLAVTTGAVSIDATGLSASNSLKLSLTNADATASAGSVAVVLSQGADSVTIVQAGAGNLDTITISGGVASLAATTVKTIDLSGVTTGGAISVTTGAGADVIKAAGIAGTYTGGLGADTFTAGAGVDTFAMGTNGSVIGTSMDSITGYGTTADILTFGAGTTLLAADATALVAGSNVQQSAGGLVTFATADSTLALKIAAIQADAQLDAAGSVAVFNDGADAYVYYAGAAIGNADDQLIHLVGVTAVSIAAGATTIVS